MSDEIEVKRPVVAMAARRTPVGAMAGTLGLVGVGVFFWLSSARAAQEELGTQLPPLAAATTGTAPQEAPAAAAPAAAAAAPVPAPGVFVPSNIPVAQAPSPVPRPVYNSPIVTSAPLADPMLERSRAPALVIDFAQADMPRMPGSGVTVRSDSGLDERGTTTVANSAANPPAGGDAGAGGGARDLSDTEEFAQRVGGAEVEVATARRMGGLQRLVPQGAIIGAVMETALNSDQPGFARAITQRDVYSFDGSAVLIPAGSRIIGQYKSGVAQGASRLFILWTRLIRPDGVSIELASPAVDDLGRGGLGGKVNRHFLQRYGGAILTSVLTGGLSALAARRSGGSTIVVNSAGQASSLAGQAGQSGDIPPTITTRQGATVRIFVARDLDFSRVGPAR